MFCPKSDMRRSHWLFCEPFVVLDGTFGELLTPFLQISRGKKVAEGGVDENTEWTTDLQ